MVIQQMRVAGYKFHILHYTERYLDKIFFNVFYN